MTAKISQPNPEDAPSWCPYFFGLVPEDNLIDALQNNRENTLDLIGAIPAEQADYQYAPDKWTVRMVLIHLLDTERFYFYRALFSARQIDMQLDFDRISYAENCQPEQRTLQSIAEEFLALRNETIGLFSGMTPVMLDYKGFAGTPVYTARSLGWMIPGHTIHHCNLLREKYLAV